MSSDWSDIPGFLDYQVHHSGEVVNIQRRKSRRLARNQQGVVSITLINDAGEQRTRSVALLVARAFVPGQSDIFNTVIHLDGDRNNCNAENLMWRPRWFAIAFHKQFNYDDFSINHIPFVDQESGEEYENFREACMRLGLYYPDIVKSCDFDKPTFPTQQQFAWIR